MEIPIALIAQLVAQYGIPFVDHLIQLWSKKGTVTPEEWATAKSLVLLPEQTLAKIAAANGVSMSDPRIVMLSNLASAKLNK